MAYVDMLENGDNDVVRWQDMPMRSILGNMPAPIAKLWRCLYNGTVFSSVFLLSTTKMLENVSSREEILEHEKERITQIMAGCSNAIILYSMFVGERRTPILIIRNDIEIVGKIDELDLTVGTLSMFSVDETMGFEKHYEQGDMSLYDDAIIIMHGHLPTAQDSNEINQL